MKSASQYTLLSENEGDQYVEEKENFSQNREQSANKTINAIIKVQDSPLCIKKFVENKDDQNANSQSQQTESYRDNQEEAQELRKDIELHSTHGVCSQCGQPLLQSNIYFGLLYCFNRHQRHFSREYFRELGIIGSGSFGTVFRVQHHIQDIILQCYAVKKVAVGDSRPWLLKVLQEVNVLQRLHHPNVVQYHHCWLENARTAINLEEEIEHLHILLEYAKGGSLNNLRPSVLGRQVTEEEFLHLLLGACRGLGHLHSLQVLSRDVKLQNFLVTGEQLDQEPTEYIHQIYGEVSLNEEVLRAQRCFKKDTILQNQSRQRLFIRNSGILNLRVMLTDFGQVGDGVSAGTEILLAPEVFLLQKHSEKSDIYSLGLTFMQLIVEGQEEFNHNEELEIMQQGAKQYQQWLIQEVRKSDLFSKKTKQLLFTLVDENPNKRPNSLQCERIIMELQEEQRKICKEIMVYTQNNKRQSFIYEEIPMKNNGKQVNALNQMRINRDGLICKQVVLTEKFTYVQMYLIIVTTLTLVVLLLH